MVFQWDVQQTQLAQYHWMSCISCMYKIEMFGYCDLFLAKTSLLYLVE